MRVAATMGTINREEDIKYISIVFKMKELKIETKGMDSNNINSNIKVTRDPRALRIVASSRTRRALSETTKEGCMIERQDSS